ncbi:TPA: hypothetical protein ACH3X3_013028 [Trebouxia sp. C0006]
MRSRDRAAGASINPQARAAHLEVHAKYGRDILGLRAPEASSLALPLVEWTQLM